MKKYVCKCITPGCREIFEVKATNREEAISKIMKLGEGHIFDKHPEMPILTSEAKKNLVAGSLETLGLALGLVVTFVSRVPVV